MVAKILHVVTAPPNLSPYAKQLHTWLTKQLEKSALAWLGQAVQQLSESASERVLFTHFSAASRQVGKADLVLTEGDLRMAQALRPGWAPGQWSVDQAARTLLLLTFPSQEATRYVAALEKLFSAADVAEQVALYQSLPLLPHPDLFTARAIDGLRTHITVVFNAIALQNPFPADYLNGAAWNQMVLKALFVGSPLSQIHGLDRRANARLAQMLSDYAHERWAADRTVNPQLWRLIGPFAEGDLIADLARVLSHGKSFEQQAAALACASARTLEAKALLDQVPTLRQQIADGQLTWGSFSHNHR
ncbi:MAG: EboA family metabolite traffic protein [Leptolyngbya sp. SIO1E4]|nr:EboA family metabolite traffic protein [Leptolyngbya sp. SIO1E4]